MLATDVTVNIPWVFVLYLRRKRKHLYQITVTIIEAKYLVQNANPLVVVKFGRQKRKTMAREQTDSPFWNEGDPQAFLNMKLSIAVYLKSYMRLKFFGGILLDVATVWDQPDHEYYQKWATLSNPKDPIGGPKGFVKCSIAVNEKGKKMKIRPERLDEDDDIEGNLLMPIAEFPSVGKHTAKYIFNIYRADGLANIKSKFNRSDSPNSNSVMNPYVQIKFAGLKGKTSCNSCTYTCRFNEKIVFTEVFPPLSYRVKIAIKDKVHSCHSITVATYTLNLAKLSNSGEYGFLPTYGPSFIHFYQSDPIDSECCYSIKCQSLQPIYRGRVLLSLKTEIDDLGSSIVPQVHTETIAPIIEKKFWNTEKYLLVGVIYNATMIDRSRFMSKSISFEMTFGNAGSHIFPHNIQIDDALMNGVLLEKRVEFDSQTEPRLTVTTDGKFNYLDFGSSKPCVYVKSWWPNFQWRISNSNSLSYIANFLEDTLGKLEELIAVENASAYENYNYITATVKQYCTEYLLILDSEKYNEIGGTTKLDRHRINVCRDAVQYVLKLINNNGALINNNYIKIAMAYAYKYLNKIRQVIKDPQDSLPDIFIWMLSGKKRVAVCRLAASNVMYSEDEIARGAHCGRRLNLFMKNFGDELEVTDYSACQLNMYLWLGNSKFASTCWNTIPSGYKVQRSKLNDSFPKYIKYIKHSKYQLRAHIFQGCFDAGLDSTGLMDPFVRIIFDGYTVTTRTIRQTLAPVWDETLVFPSVNLYGSKEDIKSNPPQIVMEAFDRDLFGMKEFFGRCITKPVVKLLNEPYSQPEFPPTLMWHKFQTQLDYQGNVLAAFELIEIGDKLIDVPASSEERIYNIPDDIRPVVKSHRLEIIFWGVRDMRKINFIRINKPRIIVECSGIHVKSEIMKNAKQFMNFQENHIIVDLDLPVESIYYPPISIEAYDTWSFEISKYAGVCIIPTAYKFIRKLIPSDEYNHNIYDSKISLTDSNDKEKHLSSSIILPLPINFDETNLSEYDYLISCDKPRNSKRKFSSQVFKLLTNAKSFLFDEDEEKCEQDRAFGNEMERQVETEDENVVKYKYDEDESYDWWSRYFASLEEEKAQNFGMKISSLGQKRISTFKIYPSELEHQPEFHGFQDKLMTFELSRGKQTGDRERDEKNYAGKFKGQIAVYPWPHPQNISYKTKSGRDASNGLLSDYPPQESVKLLVRVYIIKAINLHPCDPLTGKSDPYLVIKLGKTVINDRKNYIPNQLNPIFGKLIEIEGELPHDYKLIIQIWDHDSTSTDDLIGETKIDIENRYYSDHRGKCGLSKYYNTIGCNVWRDRKKPIEILQSICNKNNLPSPQYFPLYVSIGKEKFPFPEDFNDSERNERLALNVLHHWHKFPICGVALVPEHVERRALFNVERPGLEQGKLELWVDLFRVDDLPPKPPVNITPQVPEEYELRVTILNTEDVPLVDNQLLTGDKCSDIFVKGWINYEDNQKTDVHYNSLTGEGNFNWRFIFRFIYSKSEQLMIVNKKLSLFSKDLTEQKLPCKLYLQVWDSDHFSPDDFLGSLTLDLSRMPRGSVNSKHCTLKVIDSSWPTVSLFKVKRMKAWWPFVYVTGDDGEYVQAGKVEMELMLLPVGEANEKPAGKGRDEPDPLPPPERPDTSFSWFRNPWKTFCFVICRFYKWRVLIICIILFLIFLICTGIYAFPGYYVKKIIGA